MANENVEFSSMEIDAVGEILNISMGSAATAVSELLNAKVWITTPQVSVAKAEELATRSKKEVPHIEFQKVSFGYHATPGDTEKYCIKDISFKIYHGESLGIIGATGSGKTTLLNLLMRFYDVSEGRILIDGVDIKEIPLTVLRERFGVVFQNDTIFEDTISNNVSLGRDMDADAVRQALHHAMADKFVLGREEKEEGALNIKGANLSGGQKQRVAIAGMIAMLPECIVFDEPTAMLDPQGRREVINTARKLNAEGMSIVLITHFMEEAVFADKVIVVDGGKILAEGSPREIFAQTDMLISCGLDVPDTVKLSLLLKEKGVPIEGLPLTEEELTEEYLRILNL